MKGIIYSNSFYDSLEEGALRSARIIAPLILRLVQPGSIIDIGCGRGAWLKAFQENGVKKVVGVDGDYVDAKKCLIALENFYAADLSKPLNIQGDYDLSICLEVAEHLSAHVSSDLIYKLTKLSNLVLFSAAIPGQGGVHHINEQWPSYWSELFEKHGYLRINALQRHIWLDERVELWYRQNICLYASKKIIEVTPSLQIELELSRKIPFEIIRSDILKKLFTVKGIFFELLRLIWMSCRRKFNRI